MTDPKDFSQLIPPHGGYRELQSLEKNFLKEDGFTERLYRVRKNRK